MTLDLIARAQKFLILRDYKERGEHVIERFLDHACVLLKAFALASATKEAQAVKTEVAFFQTVRAALTKTTGRTSGARDADLDHAIRRSLRRHGYPPDRQEAATRLIIEQAELFARSETEVVPVYRG